MACSDGGTQPPLTCSVPVSPPAWKGLTQAGLKVAAGAGKWEVWGYQCPRGGTSVPAAPALTTGSAVLYWDGSFLVALSFLALAVVAVGAAVAGADGPVGAVAIDAVTGAASGAAAVQADGVELALISTFVWEDGGEQCSHPPRGQGLHCQKHGMEQQGRSGN